MSDYFTTPWTVADQAPLSMGFPRREYWSGFPFPSPGDLLNPGMKLKSPAWQADSLPLSHQGSPQYQNCIQAKLLQLYPILCNPMDCNPPGSSANFQHSINIIKSLAISWYVSLQPLSPPQRLQDGVEISDPLTRSLRLVLNRKMTWLDTLKGLL